MGIPTTIFSKNIWMYPFSNFTSIWNCVCCQYCTVLPVCCGALSCITTSMLYYNFTHSHKKRKDYGTFPFLRSFGNANLILIWPHHHFQQKNMKVLYWPKYQCWSWYTVIKFVWSSTTSSWSPEICYRYTAIQFVCSWSTSRKELIVKFIKVFRHFDFFQLYTWKNESVGISDSFKYI